MTETLHRIREIAARIRRLQFVLKNFNEDRQKLMRLHASAEGNVRIEIEQGLAINQAAIEARQRELAMLESEMAQRLRQLPDGVSRELSD